MKIGPKYKIARRLGVPIFEKTQTQKYALSLARKEKSGKTRMRPKSEFGLQLLEKQKARFTYGVGERQFRGYVERARKSDKPQDKLYNQLERRLDNVVYRSGFTKTRAQARQAVSHGHLLLNAKRVTIPSITLKEGDKVSIRAGSGASMLWSTLDERLKEVTGPAWIKVDPVAREISVVALPVLVPVEQVFDLGAVIEFYNR